MKSPTIHFLTVAILACLPLSALGQGDVAAKPVPAPETRIPTRGPVPKYIPASGPRQPTPVYTPQSAASETPHNLSIQLHPMDQLQQNRVLQRELAKLLEKEEQLRHELEDAHRELNSQQPKNLPPLKNGKLHAYRLQHIDPKLLAETLESFLGTNQLRLVPDVENNILLTYSSEEVSKQISDLVKVLDAEKESNDFNISPFQAKEKTQSLQVRIFWLADGIGNSEPDEYLPEAVIEAVRRLGLQNPQLVSQSASSVAGKPGGDSNFQFNFPATIGNETLQFTSDGVLFLGPQPQLDIQVSIESLHPIELAGKLSAPLGHYMVLGTTNYAAGRSSAPRAGGRARARSAGDPPREASAEHEEAPKFTTSRFAFVVQVVEAESFAPEEERLGIRQPIVTRK